MYRFTIILLAALFMSGCTQFIPSLQKQITPRDQRSFTRALDSFRSTNHIGLLKKFRVEYPDSDWAPRADTIILYALELDRRKTQLEKKCQQIEQQNVELKVQKEKNLQMSGAMEELSLHNQKLSEQITQLKGLLIQSEQRLQ